jgi:hypothetical protein
MLAADVLCALHLQHKWLQRHLARAQQPMPRLPGFAPQLAPSVRPLPQTPGTKRHVPPLVAPPLATPQPAARGCADARCGVLVAPLSFPSPLTDSPTELLPAGAMLSDGTLPKRLASAGAAPRSVPPTTVRDNLLIPTAFSLRRVRTTCGAAEAATAPLEGADVRRSSSLAAARRLGSVNNMTASLLQRATTTASWLTATTSAGKAGSRGGGGDGPAAYAGASAVAAGDPLTPPSPWLHSSATPSPSKSLLPRNGERSDSALLLPLRPKSSLGYEPSEPAGLNRKLMTSAW